MKRKIVLATVLCLALVSLAGVAAAPAAAVVGGQQDTDNQYSNVGMKLEWDLWVPGQLGFAGSCTLIKNDANGVVAMTVAHALWPLDAPTLAKTRITFDPLTAYDWFVSIPTLPDTVETYGVTAAVLHPGFDTDTPYTGWGGAKRNVIGPGREDVALMWLDHQVTVPGDPDTLVEPAPIVGLGGLEGLAVKGETFAVVGYGLNDFLAGNQASFTQAGNGAATWNGRNYGEASVVSEHEAFADRFLKLTSSVSSFDSGGAVFHGGAIVGLPALGSPRYESPCYIYRLDTQLAQDFVNSWLVHGPPPPPE